MYIFHCTLNVPSFLYIRIIVVVQRAVFKCNYYDVESQCTENKHETVKDWGFLLVNYRKFRDTQSVGCKYAETFHILGLPAV